MKTMLIFSLVVLAVLAAALGPRALLREIMKPFDAFALQHLVLSMAHSNDLHSNVQQKLAVAPVVLGATGNNAGRIIDRKGYGGVEFLVEYGAVTTTGTVVTPILKEGDVTGALTSVADADMIGSEALAGLAAATSRASGTTKLVTKRLGYKGNKRYVQLSLNGTGTTSVGIVAASAILFNPEIGGVANP